MSGLLLLFCVVLSASAFINIKQLVGDVRDSNLPDLDECGFQSVTRITGGIETVPGEFPWLAALEYEWKSTQDSDGIKCGGSVINHRFILTAAHCLYPRRFNLIKVWLGVWKISLADTTDADKVRKFDIVEKIIHESYTSADAGYDIALLKVDQDIEYTDYIRPICIAKKDVNLPPYGTLLTVTGWGVTETGSMSDVKLKVDLPVVENQVCESTLNRNLIESQMCAGGEPGKDSCVGDSGGPLMANVTDPATGRVHFFPFGIVSYGIRSCAQANIPGVYTRAPKFGSWIVDKLQQYS